MRNRYALNWSVGYTPDRDRLPDKMVPAAVPGAVQLDWARACGWGDYTYADNWKDYLWMEEVFWLYTAKISFHELKVNESLFLVFKGIDYEFAILHNDRLLHKQEGMFTPVELLLSDVRPGDELKVLVFPAPKREGAPYGRAQADQSCKPAVSYGWDWHPRLVPLGIFDEAYIEIRPKVHIRRAEVRYTLAEDLSKADVTLSLDSGINSVATSDAQFTFEWEMLDPEGKTVFTRSEYLSSESHTLSQELNMPALWWPNGQGEPLLYRYSVKLFNRDNRLIDKKDGRIGFRKAQLVMHPGAWRYPNTFPKGRSNPPVTLEINGREIFCKGSNWVNPEIFPGIITKDTYRPLIEMAKDASMNLLRCWGGAPVNKESFYELCDEEGIMVWQEFPLACNNYIGTPEYLSVLDQESRSVILKLRFHPSVVIWCGGNELFNFWSKMTDQSLALRLLDRNCFDLDPLTPFLKTSPLMGMAHGNYLFRYLDGRDVFQVMPKANNTAYTEFGCPGPSPVEYLKTFIPPDELYPPRPETAWETHHAFKAWEPDCWLNLNDIEYYFGACSSLEEMVERGMLLQCEGYKCIFEEARRQKPICSMALNWCYNEPWPTAANNSLINWPHSPKPSYYAVKASCRPLLASARISRFTWQEGDVFDPELWLLNDLPETVPAGTIEAFLELGGKEMRLLTWDYPDTPANTNAAGPMIRFRLPGSDSGRMTLKLCVKGYPEFNSQYTLVYRRLPQAVALGSPRTNV